MKIIDEDKLLKFFILLFLDFETVWKSENNYFINENGFTSHGVCAEFSHYFKEDYKKFSDEQVKGLFNKVEELITNSELGNEIDNALCACFLENIIQTESGRYAKQFMGNRSRKFFDYWN